MRQSPFFVRVQKKISCRFPTSIAARGGASALEKINARVREKFRDRKMTCKKPLFHACFCNFLFVGLRAIAICGARRHAV
jgi:hypothetical protein